MVNAQVSQSFLQGLLGGSICDNEGCFLVVDFETSFTELFVEFMPCCHNILSQCVCIVVAAVKPNVVHPSIEMKLRMIGLEWVAGMLWQARVLGDVEPVTEFRVGYHSLWSALDLRGKLEGQGRVVEGLCHLLEFGEIYGVIESAHVEQDSDAMLPQGFVALLSRQPLELPGVEDGLPEAAPGSVEHTGECDRSFHLFVLGQRHHHTHLELCG